MLPLAAREISVHIEGLIIPKGGPPSAPWLEVQAVPLLDFPLQEMDKRI